jgi:chromosome segregation ATPase
MLKKVVIAGLAVAVGVAVLAWVSPPLFDWMCHGVGQVKQHLDDSVPPEQRIEILKDKLKALEQNKSKYFDAVAKEAVEVDKLAADVDKMSDNVALQWKRIDIMRDDLNTQKVRFTYGGQDYKRTDVEKQLASDFDSVKTAEQALDAKKDLLSARKQSLDAAKEQLSTLGQRRDEMAARIAKMEADLKLVRMREEKASLKLDDNEYSSLNAEIDQVSGKISERQKALDLKAQFSEGAGVIDPLAKDPTPKGDILKQIDDYKAAKNGAPKINIAEQK